MKKYYKAVRFTEQLIRGDRFIVIHVNDDPKMIAQENPGFAGGWDVKTMSGKEVGFFQTLNDIEVFINV